MIKSFLFFIIVFNIFADVSFIVLGDWGDKGRKFQVPVARAMETIAKQRKVDFITTVGDNFYQKGVSGIDDPHWKLSFENIYNTPYLKTLDWYVTLGNHDCRSSREAQVEYSKINSHWKLPEFYYKEEFDQFNLKLIVLDTSTFIPGYVFSKAYQNCIMEPERIRAQKEWFLQEINHKTDKWKIVIGHHPFYSSGVYKDKDVKVLKKDFLPELKKNADLYISGHEHHLEVLKDDDLTFVVSGGGHETRTISNHPLKVFAVESPGFVLVTLKKDTGTIELINQEAEVLYRHQIKKR